MSNPTIASAAISALEHPISALDDRPALAADDRKAYFDADPQQLCEAHNTLVSALTAPEGASGVGFLASDTISANTVQDALENVHKQMTGLTLGSVPDGSINSDKLDSSLKNQLNKIDTLESAVTELQQAVNSLHPSGAQYPLMVLALSENCPSTLTDEMATAALGAHFESEVYDLGIQLAWLCRWKNSTLPSTTFRSKQTIDEIFADVNTLSEIEQLTPVRSLISLSAEISRAYRTAMDEAGL